MIKNIFAPLRRVMIFKIKASNMNIGIKIHILFSQVDKKN